MRLGIVGLPNSGKSTLFNALTGLQTPTAPHPFSTTEPKVGVAHVADPLLDRLAEIEGSAEVVHAGLELVDLPASFYSPPGHLDGLMAVLRAFDDPAVPGESDPIAQADQLGLELALADLEVLQHRWERVAKEATADPSKRASEAVLAEAIRILEDGRPLRHRGWQPEERLAFSDTSPLTLKPLVWVVNVAEGSAPPELPGGDHVVNICARLEEEGAQLPHEVREELFEAMGLGESALESVLEACYQALELITFYTVNRREARAWILGRGATARQAAGKIHSDLERGFIRGEVAGIEAVIEAGGWDPARKASAVRVEGKDYQLADREVLLVRFSV